MNNYKDSIDRMIAETGLGRTEIEKILLIFFESTHNIQEELDLALKNNDFKMIQKIAHKIKGTCGNLRLEWIKTIVEELEIAGNNRDIETCKNLTEELNYHIDKYAEYI